MAASAPPVVKPDEPVLLPRKHLRPEVFFLYRTRCMLAKLVELRGYAVNDEDRYMWEDDFVTCFGTEPPRHRLNFVVCKADDEHYKLVVVFHEGNPNACDVRRYGDYMRQHAFRWMIVVLVNSEPTRQARRAVANLTPRLFIEFINAEDVSDWSADRPGFDYGPRWPGDPGIRVLQQQRREAIGEMLIESKVQVADPELDKLLEKFAPKAQGPMTTKEKERLRRLHTPAKSRRASKDSTK